jgi:hypothetical protein
MGQINNSQELQDRIEELEQIKLAQHDDLQFQLTALSESLNPLNVIKNAIHTVFPKRGINGNVIVPAVGLAAGIFVKKLLMRKTNNLMSRIIGGAIQFAVAAVMGRQTAKIGRKGDIYGNGRISDSAVF